MSTLNDVQNAMVNVITPVIYPNGTGQPSVIGNRVSSFVITNGGSNYTTATVTISGGGGIGAIATATIANGAITSINLVNVIGSAGFGYTQAPTVTIIGDGTGATATATITSIPIYVFAGDPLKLDLDAILKANEAVIAVFATRGMTRNTTRIRREYVDQVIQTATLFLNVSGNTVTVNGSVTANESCMVIVNNVGYAYRALSNDTLNSIASALANLIPNATANNNIITIANTYNIVARVSVPGQARRILHSQESVMRARIITQNNQMRDVLGNAIQIGFGVNGYYLPMPDLISASIKPNDIQEINTYELDLAFVRDYLYLVEYHTVQVSDFQTIADVNAEIEVRDSIIQ